MQHAARNPNLSTLPISVVVRSFARPTPLLELVERLAAQAYRAFEVVILEQTEDSAFLARLKSTLDARFRVVPSRRRDPPAARNEAVRHARGEILLFIDDDDLPIGQNWIELHARNYLDPRCMGVVGRATRDPFDRTAPRFPRLLRKLAMRHTFFKDTVAMAHNTLRKDDVDFLIGTNASVRRSLVDRIGGWDEGVSMHEEQSFAFKFQRHRQTGERFVFDPGPTIQRRTDLPGGLSRRSRENWHRWELMARLHYYEQVVGHYFPQRYRRLRPLFAVRGVEQTLRWIWDPDNGHRSPWERARATFDLILSLPSSLRARCEPYEPVRRVPCLVASSGALRPNLPIAQGDSHDSAACAF
jgi:glycosyltransferase involved in cell wall biosynthesis